ncbi:MAG: nickel-dependent hydrogenase large subunit [Candidatus Bathyarchaeota archaeon]|nr:nickel-dependent hydrogenase large subunit [Candidatus Bathyarchaeota archaeon]
MKTFKIPFGPQHPALEEPISFIFEVEEERVIDVKTRLGYIHRGIEKIGEDRTYQQNIYLAERICGICSFAHALCYTQAVEELLRVEISERAKFIRTIMAEMERIQNHYLWLGFTAKEMGFETLFMYSWRDRETILEILEMISGKRVNYGMSTIGGVRRDITAAMMEEIESRINLLENRARYYKKVCTKEETILKRTVGVGMLRPRDARRLCAVGPTIRASGIQRDVRADEPYAAYSEVPFRVITYKGCDVASRIYVRIDEILESIKIIRYALKNMPEGLIKVKFPRKIPEGEAISLVEAPRGEDIHYVKSNGSDKPERWKVRAPTLANLLSLCKMLIGVNIADIPVVIAGIDPCIACAERVVLVEAKSKKQRVWSGKELWRYANEWYQRQ